MKCNKRASEMSIHWKKKSTIAHFSNYREVFFLYIYISADNQVTDAASLRANKFTFGFIVHFNLFPLLQKEFWLLFFFFTFLSELFSNPLEMCSFKYLRLPLASVFQPARPLLFCTDCASKCNHIDLFQIEWIFGKALQCPPVMLGLSQLLFSGEEEGWVG